MSKPLVMKLLSGKGKDLIIQSITFKPYFDKTKKKGKKNVCIK